MNPAEENGATATVISEGSPEDVCLEPSRNRKTPFVPQKEKTKPLLGDTGRLVFIGAGIVLVFLLFAFNSISRRSSPAPKRSARNSQSQNAMHIEDINSSTSVTPILDAGRSPEQNADDGRVDPDQIRRLATMGPREPAERSLGDVRPFGSTQAWEPAPYSPGSEPATMPDIQVGRASAAQSINDREGVEKVSLVFVRNNTSSTAQNSQEPISQIDFGIDLPPGAMVRARLESAISTAVHTPVVAVIQYNYEQHGEIVIPAGAKAFGRLESADRSGYLGIRFDSLQMPDGSSFGFDACATDLQLRPLRGKVEGKHARKSILVRSFAGVGEIASTLAGRGRLNQPLSSEDLLRERISNNIGQASDQSIAGLALTENVVVSVPAGKEIYVVMQKSARQRVAESGQAPLQATSRPSIEEVNQLLQLQRELNQATAKQPE